MSKKYKYKKTFTYGDKRYYVRGDTLKEVMENMAKKRTALERGE